MSQITVRVLREDHWQQFRDIRLAALRDSPEAFVASAEQESQLDDHKVRAAFVTAMLAAAERSKQLASGSG